MDCFAFSADNSSLNSSNDSFTSLIELEYDIDTESIFNPVLSFNQPSFWIGAGVITLISFIVSYIISYHYYPFIDRKQKLLKLKALNVNPYSKKDINPCLDTHTNKIQDINNTVFDFANINSKSVNSILDSTIEKQPLYYHLISYLFISTLLIASYFQFYWVISHWNDAYKSWIETQCYPFIGYSRPWSYTVKGRTHSGTDHYYHYLQVNMNNICGDYDNHDFIFYLDIDFDVYDYQHEFNRDDIMNIDTSDSVPCYVHKDNFKVRAPIEQGEGCCCSYGCIRCGRCTDGCCGYNACAYWPCILCGSASLCTFLYLCIYKLQWNISDKYNNVEIIELSEIESNQYQDNENNESHVLLRIKENESDIY